MRSSFSFKNFAGREESLKNIKRYSVYTTMYYRTDLWLHAHRVLWIVETLMPLATKVFPNFDTEKARILALVHDDAEIITTDINLVCRVQMSPEELRQVDINEEKAIEELAERWPREINSFNYKQLLTHAFKKDCVEAQIMSLADKLDGCGESLHELFAGNRSFTLPENISPIELYQMMLPNYAQKYPALRKIMSLEHPSLRTIPILQSMKRPDIVAIARNGQPHTSLSATEKSRFPHYDFWKQLTIEKLGDEGMRVLTVQQEFLP